ncbi:kinase-like domain-containing protein [Mycena rosella]|uniref:Kinase-like domain-containing protein n=1 Tax=Mycena rosella TaxID=1033263 RepID=A0AAD7DYE6_MYCRO|nr:kinase-like domain-containing protein [Mycena rosella]
MPRAQTCGLSRRATRSVVCTTVYDHSKVRYVSQGRFGVVYSTMKIGSDVKVAAKRMRFKDSAVGRESDSEIDILQSLKGLPGVCQILGVFYEAHSIDIVLEWVSGGDLYTQTLHREFGEETVKHIARQICATMVKVHEMNVVHRDVKPHNIVVSDATLPDVTILDFGSGKRALTAMNTWCGSTAYMSPERIPGKPYGREVDTWSVGIIISCLLAKACWERLDRIERVISRSQAGSLVGDILHCLRDISPDGQDFVRELLQIDPEARMSFQAALNHSWFSAAVPKPHDVTDTGLEEHQRFGEVLKRTGSLTLSVDGEDTPSTGDAIQVSTSPAQRRGKRRRSEQEDSHLSQGETRRVKHPRTRTSLVA